MRLFTGDGGRNKAASSHRDLEQATPGTAAMTQHPGRSAGFDDPQAAHCVSSRAAKHHMEHLFDLIVDAQRQGERRWERLRLRRRRRWQRHRLPLLRRRRRLLHCQRWLLLLQLRGALLL